MTNFKNPAEMHAALLNVFNLEPGKTPSPFIRKGAITFHFDEAQPHWLGKEYASKVGGVINPFGIYICGWVATRGDSMQRALRLVIPAINLDTGEVMFKSLGRSILRDPFGKPYPWLIQSDSELRHVPIGNFGFWKVAE